jgi:hypothetical protein
MDATPVPEPVAQFAAICGTDAPTYLHDRPGMSAFVLEDGVVYHTYSDWSRPSDLPNPFLGCEAVSSRGIQQMQAFWRLTHSTLRTVSADSSGKSACSKPS